MRTGAERLAGDYEGATFPLNGVCSLYFPLASDRIRQKRNAGVAELVDALDLGNSASCCEIKSLDALHRNLWGLVRSGAQKATA